MRDDGVKIASTVTARASNAPLRQGFQSMLGPGLKATSLPVSGLTVFEDHSLAQRRVAGTVIRSQRSANAGCRRLSTLTGMSPCCATRWRERFSSIMVSQPMTLRYGRLWGRHLDRFQMLVVGAKLCTSLMDQCGTTACCAICAHQMSDLLLINKLPHLALHGRTVLLLDRDLLAEPPVELGGRRDGAILGQLLQPPRCGRVLARGA